MERGPDGAALEPAADNEVAIGEPQKNVAQPDLVKKQSENIDPRDNVIDINLPLHIETHKSASQLHAEHNNNKDKMEEVVSVPGKDTKSIDTNEYAAREPVVERNAPAAESVARLLSQSKAGGYHPADLLLWLKADEGLESGENVSLYVCMHV